VLIGGNGSGKTTLMRCLYGLQDKIDKIDAFDTAGMKLYQTDTAHQRLHPDRAEQAPGAIPEVYLGFFRYDIPASI
jgi:ABC-type Mn2+/Zn2+ transport system ATPase subunit